MATRSFTTSSSPVNSTLLQFASVDVGEPKLRKEVEELVDGGFAFASDSTISLHLCVVAVPPP
ncbi:hypothetical protein Taro_020553 [Colocasia esculenta]|uniref:Uncharacterized protein n=1 Tax=Colocasia esculenta TaxID=4460 RepID=A0A843V2Q8_COLES|nr:hypothetical protein [Colocasia esculenta]